MTEEIKTLQLELQSQAHLLNELYKRIINIEKQFKIAYREPEKGLKELNK